MNSMTQRLKEAIASSKLSFQEIEEKLELVTGQCVLASPVSLWKFPQCEIWRQKTFFILIFCCIISFIRYIW